MHTVTQHTWCGYARLHELTLRSSVVLRMELAALPSRSRLEDPVSIKHGDCLLARQFGHSAAWGMNATATGTATAAPTTTTTATTALLLLLLLITADMTDILALSTVLTVTRTFTIWAAPLAAAQRLQHRRRSRVVPCS